MNTNPIRLASTLVKSSKVLVIFEILIAITVLVGWELNIEFLKRIIPGVVAMNPLTAILFILSGGAFFLLQSQHNVYRRLGQGIVVLVVILAIVKLFEYATGATEGIDTYFFATALAKDRLISISNRMAINTSLSFILIGVALILSFSKKKRAQSIAIYLTIINLFAVLLFVVGYIFVVDVFYNLLVYLPMALHTAINFMLLSLALFFAFPNRGFMAEAISAHAGGVAARRVLPIIFFIPISLGVLLLVGEKRAWYNYDFGLAIYCLGIIMMFLIAMWRVIKILNHVDKIRDKASSDLQEANRFLEIRATQLEASNRELEAFSYSVSHDLRAPLRAICGYAQILQDEYRNTLDEEGEDMLNTITKNGNRMGELIDDLLRYSKVGRSDIKRVVINMETLAKNIFKELNFNHSALDFKVEPMPLAKADYTLVSLLYQNLISNAIKFSSKKDNPQIVVGANTIEEKVVYFVRDNGAGFDMRHYDKLFGVFHRLHKQEEFEGTGVGLAIAQKATLAHHGEIWAESTLGKSTCFYFSLKPLPSKMVHL